MITEGCIFVAEGAEGAVRQGPLAGLRVVEMGTLIAGPFCGQILADFGAEVIQARGIRCASGDEAYPRDIPPGGR